MRTYETLPFLLIDMVLESLECVWVWVARGVDLLLVAGEAHLPPRRRRLLSLHLAAPRRTSPRAAALSRSAAAATHVDSLARGTEAMVWRARKTREGENLTASGDSLRAGPPRAGVEGVIQGG